ncbi:MAG: aminotransferase [Phycisphaeraceae bacterium]|nr:aminotransferase [Phycisphaeraceae bacterium]
MLTDATRQRDFPSLRDRAYLNTAAEGISPPVVAEALAQYARDRLLGMDGRPLHEQQREAARERVGRAYGLSADEIGICSCSSEAYNLARVALGLREGDEVIINDLDFPSGATGWLQPSCPATVRIWRARDGALRIEDLVPLLGPKTRLLTVSLVSFYNGYRIPLGPILEAYRRHCPGLLALDVTQALGRIPLSLDDVDLVVSSTHKWILACHGGGLVGVPARRAADLTSSAGGWFHLEDAFGPERFEHVQSRPGAASYGVGMPNYGAIYAINAGLGYIESVGVEAIDRHAAPLVQACLAGLKKLPVELLTPDEPNAIAGILAVRHDEAERIHRALHQQDIHIMYHAGRLRIAIHGYNTMDDVDRLLAATQEQLS